MFISVPTKSLFSNRAATPADPDPDDVSGYQKGLIEVLAHQNLGLLFVRGWTTILRSRRI